MIAKKTLKLSLKSLRDFAKKRLPDQELIELDARDECPLEVVRDMCGPKKLGLYSRGVRRFWRRRLRRVLRLRRDGADRSGCRYVRAGHVSGQRSNHGGRHSGAEEGLADTHRGRGNTVRLRRH